MKNLIVVKKDIRFGTGYNTSPILKAGVYDLDYFTKYPFFDTSNIEYFTKVLYAEIPDGTKVVYNGDTYYTKLDENGYYSRARFSTDRKNGIKVDMPYKLYKSMTNDKSYKTTINESYFDICRFYFFINSEGSLCKAFEGQKPHADKWRKMVNNYFETEEECREMINKINEPDKKVKFIFEWIK